MTARTVWLWSMVHRWTGLLATLFLLLLCLTGLPLIFHHELDELMGYAPRPQAGGARPPAPVQRIADAALAADPGRVLQYIAWDKDEPGVVTAFTNSAPDGKPDDATVRAFDAGSAALLGPVGTGPMLIVLKLHTDMFAGLPGKLFLGAMGLVFVAAIISGVALYGPFTRRIGFAAIRDGSARRVAWLDWHNFLGVVTVAWALVVGSTGVVNTLAEPMLSRWKATELAQMVMPYAGRPAPSHLVSLDEIVAQAGGPRRGWRLPSLPFPGHHSQARIISSPSCAAIRR